MNQAKPPEATHVGSANSIHGKHGGNGKELGLQGMKEIRSSIWGHIIFEISVRPPGGRVE